MRSTFWAVVAMGLAVSVAFGEDMVENPQYKNWAAFKPGAMAKYQMVSISDAGGQETTTKMTMSATLKELTADKAVVETVMEMEVNGQKTAMPAQSQDVPAKVAASAASQPAAQAGVTMTKKGEGDEDVAVGDKKYKAHWVENQMSSEQFEGTTKAWTSTQVPGGMVKSTMESTKPVKSKTTTELVEFKVGG